MMFRALGLAVLFCATWTTAQASDSIYITPPGTIPTTINDSSSYTWQLPSGWDPSVTVQGFILQVEGNSASNTSNLTLTLYDNSTGIASVSLNQSAFYEAQLGTDTEYNPITFNFGTAATLNATDTYTATLSYTSGETGGGGYSVLTDAPEPGSLSMIGIGVFALLAGHKWSKK